MTEPQKFASYDEFFEFYLKQHSDPLNRLLHAIGTTLGVTVVVGALILGHPWYALLFFPIGYGFAWIGHFRFEKNRPASFKRPLYSFMGDWVMYKDIWLGKIPF